jgi:2-keto-4-pentenoate hydratase
MQRQLRVSVPDYGHLLNDMFWLSGESIARDRFLQPRIEAEIAVILNEDLGLVGIDAAAVAASTRSLAPALEIIDSRVRDWRIGILDTVADNASAGGVVVGGEIAWNGSPRPRDLACALSRNGSVVATGVGSDVLGDPFEAVAWLARTLAARGTQLRAGQLILPGSCTAAVPCEVGDSIVAAFGALGSVGITFH